MGRDSRAGGEIQMCGIAGIVSVEPDRGLAARVAAMTQTLYHRGPDDGGVVAFGQVSGISAARLGRPGEPMRLPSVPAHAALGARRLAILDLSDRGHQPMAARDRLAWIVHNGEIYNYIELRDALSSEGWVFETGTDTEVFLAAWQAWGPGCIDRFDGMWATAIYEPDARRLTLTRDPFGIKPLYYARLADGFAFASEIKALLTLPRFVRRVNPPRMTDFLCEGWLDHTEETLFEGVHALSGGCRLCVTASEAASLRVEFHRDGDPASLASASCRPAACADLAAELRRALQDSVRIQLRSDVTVGSCLSGGIDSSAIVTTLCALRDPTELAGGWSQHTFTAVLPGDPLDESRYVDIVAAACPDLRGHRVAPTAEGLLADMDALVWHQDEPFGSPSIYMQWEVMKAAGAAGVRVLLDGQGGDELFCGYSGYFPPWLAQLVRDSRWHEAFGLFRSPRVRRYFGRTGLAAHAAAHLAPDSTRAALRRGIRRWQHGWLDSSLFRSDDRRAEGRHAGASGAPRFERYWLDLLLHRSLPGLLHFEDRSAMAYSVEARVPFLGRGPSQLAAAIPPDFKLRGGVTKAILRDAMRGRVPDAILDRTDKIGFAAPTLRWMQRPLREWWRDILSSAPSRQRGWIHVSRIDPLVQRLDAGDPAAALVLWRLAIAEQWAQRMIDHSWRC